MNGVRLFNGVLFIMCLVIGCNSGQEKIELDQEQPDFLAIVAPHSEQIVTMEEFKTGKHFPEGEYIAQREASNKICIKVIQTSLLEPGDNFSGRQNEPGDYFPERLSLTINGQNAERDDDNFAALLNLVVLRNENNDIVAQAVGPQVICWLTDLGEGTHVAVLNARKTSGEIVSYSWQFEIVK
jgi:hypothetical protein